MKLAWVRWSKKLVPLFGVIATCIVIKICVSGPNAVKMTLPNSLLHGFNDDSEQGHFNFRNKSPSILTPKTNIVFLKIHKAASSTIQNIFLRYALSQKLDVLLPKRRDVFHINEHSNKLNPQNIIRLPPGAHFNILTHHLLFRKANIRRFVPPDTVYIGIVREPYSRFVSSLYYYGLVWNFTRLHDCIQENEDPVNAFLKDPFKYDPQRQMAWSQVNNRMSRDFGLSVNGVNSAYSNGAIIDEFTKRVESELDLVLVMEHFDASIIMMKRLLNWTFEDVLYMKINELGATIKQSTKSNAEINKVLFNKYGPSEVALYDHFLSIFLNKVKLLGHDFLYEVEAFKQIKRIVENFCEEMLIEGLNSHKILEVDATNWSPSFQITSQCCSLMKMDEVLLTSVVRVSQNSRRYHTLRKMKRKDFKMS